MFDGRLWGGFVGRWGSVSGGVWCGGRGWIGCRWIRRGGWRGVGESSCLLMFSILLGFCCLEFLSLGHLLSRGTWLVFLFCLPHIYFIIAIAIAESSTSIFNSHDQSHSILHTSICEFGVAFMLPA